MAAVVASVSVAALGACGGEPAETPPPVTVSPDIESTRTTPPEPVVPTTWPLTGVQTAEYVSRPAVAVKIENTSQARPQSGLESADVVWETIIEFEVSRLVAWFHSQLPEEIGPVRSVRPMDIPISAPLRGLFVYSGAQPAILNLVYASPLQPVSHDAGAAGLYRVSGRSAPHNVYGSLSTFVQNADADHSAPPAEQFAFAPRPNLAGAVTDGTPATSLSFTLSAASHPSWAWDADSGRWLRSEGSSPATDATGAQLGAVNVVTVIAGHPSSGYGAQNGASIPTYELVGEGEAIVATGGMTVSGVWRKAAEDAPLQLFTADGQPLLLAPGNTWVELVPAGSGSVTVG